MHQNQTELLFDFAAGKFVFYSTQCTPSAIIIDYNIN